MDKIALVSLIGDDDRDLGGFGTLPVKPIRVCVKDLTAYLRTPPDLLIVDAEDVVKLSLAFPPAKRIPCPVIFCVPAVAEDLDRFLSDPPRGLVLLKPFDPVVLRTYASLIIGGKNEDLHDIVEGDLRGAAQHKSLVVDHRSRRVFVSGRLVRLTPKEFELLSFLYRDPGRIYSGSEIINSVWAGRKRASSLDVQQYIHHLRKKIEPDPHQPRYIKNVKGFGYTLDLANSN